MNNSGRVIIIPDENQILLDKYEFPIMTSHIEGFNDFSKRFKLGYKFTYNDFNTAPVVIAGDGHLVIKTLDDLGMAIFYIPVVVTDREYEWYQNNKYEFRGCTMVDAYSLGGDKAKQLSGLSNISKEIKNKNILYRESFNSKKL